MAKSRTVRVEILSDARGFRNGTDAAAADLDRFAASAEALDRATLPAAAAMAGIGAAAMGAAGAAADAAASVAKSSTVWSTQADSMSKWASTAAEAVGMSSSAALSAAAGLGNYWQALGKTETEAASLSTGTVQLAADLAAFAADGTSTSEVLDMITGAFRGEYDSIQRLIPTISAASVEAKALELSHKKSADALTDADKATAAYRLMVEGAGPAVGAFAASSGQAATQHATLTATVQNLAAQLGTALLPAYQGLLATGLAVTQWASEHTGAVTALAVVIGGLSAVVLTTSAAVKVYETGVILAKAVTELWNTGVLQSIATNTAYYGVLALTAAQIAAETVAAGAAKVAQLAWTGVVKAARGAQLLFNAALSANPIGAVIALVSALAAGLVYAYQHCDTFRAIVDRLSSLLSGAVMSAFRAVSGVVGAFADAIGFAWDMVSGLIGAVGRLLSALNPFKSGGVFGGLFNDEPAAAPTTAEVTLTADGRPRRSRSAAPPLAAAAPRVAGTRSLGAFRGASAAPGGQVVNITVTGALDPVAVAAQIDALLRRRSRLVGSA